ncbi:MAG: tetracycline destructase [Gammaproteobacteria bacterium]|nr:tetracycline destructase [Gammaproteobacteria bacterium]
MSKPQNILVIGASVAGPAVCYWLKKFGFTPTLIEKNKQLRQGGYAIDIRGIAIDIVKQMGLYEQICDQRTRLAYGRYVDALGNILHEEQGEKFGFRQGEDVEIVRGDLVELLMRGIEDIPCYFDQNIDAITQHEAYVEVHFKEGRTDHYDLVIGADGLHSSIRQMLFAQEYQRVNLGSYLSVFSIPNYLHLDHSEILFEQQEKLVHVSSDKNSKRAHAGFMFRSQKILSERSTEQEQRDFLTKTFQNMGWEANKLLELMQYSDDFYFDAIEQIKMTSWTKGRVALVGDSGYCASPLSGQGTSLALVGAYLLAGELRTAEEDYSQAFARYNELLRPFIKANQDFGAWASESFLLPSDASKEVVEKRAEQVLKKLHIASHAITLPLYSF